MDLIKELKSLGYKVEEAKSFIKIEHLGYPVVYWKKKNGTLERL